MKIKKIGVVFWLGFMGFIWMTSGFSAQPYRQKTTSQSQIQRQGQGAHQIQGTQMPQMQRRENNQAYFYKCRIDSTNRGASFPYFIYYSIYKPQGENGPTLKTVNIPLRCDAERPEGRSGWYMSIGFDTLDEATNFYNFIQNKTLYGLGVPRGEMLEFSSYYIGDR